MINNSFYYIFAFFLWWCFIFCKRKLNFLWYFICCFFLVNNSGGVFLLSVSGKARFFPAVKTIWRFGNFIINGIWSWIIISRLINLTVWSTISILWEFFWNSLIWRSSAIVISVRWLLSRGIIVIREWFSGSSNYSNRISVIVYYFYLVTKTLFLFRFE